MTPELPARGAREPGIAAPETAPGDGAPHGGALAVLGVVVLLAPLYCAGLGTVPIVGDDEAREVGIIQDIAERGHWLLPRFNATVLPDKPPLYHWLAAAGCAAAGRCDETMVRLPSVLAALALVAVVGLAAARWFSGPAGVAGALLLGCSPALYGRARSARPDVLMILLLTVTLLAFYEWWRTGGARRRHAVIIGAALGLAVLAKGPVAPAITAVVVVAFLAVRGEPGRLRALARRDLLLPLGILACAWYAVALAGWGPRFARQHLLGRYLGNLVGGGLALGIQPDYSPLYHFGFYPLHLLLVTLPWTPLLVVALIAAWRGIDGRRDPRLQFAQLWIAAVAVTFGLAVFKMRHYVLPALPAAALLAAPVAVALSRFPASRGATDARRSPRMRVAAAATVAGLAVVASLALLPGAQEAAAALLSRSDRELLDALQESIFRRPAAATVVGVALALLGAGALGAAAARRGRHALWLTAAATVVWMTAVQSPLHMAVARTASLDAFAAEIRRLVPVGAPLYFHRRVLRPLVVYLRRPVPSLRGDVARALPGPIFVIGLRGDLLELRGSGARVRVLARRSGRIGNLERGRVVLVRVNDPASQERERPAASASARR